MALIEFSGQFSGRPCMKTYVFEKQKLEINGYFRSVSERGETVSPIVVPGFQVCSPVKPFKVLKRETECENGNFPSLTLYWAPLAKREATEPIRFCESLGRNC